MFAGGGPDGIRVNVVAPLVRSRVMEETFPTRESIEALRLALSLRRPAEPRDVGRMVAFLVSGNAAFTTGQPSRSTAARATTAENLIAACQPGGVFPMVVTNVVMLAVASRRPSPSRTRVSVTTRWRPAFTIRASARSGPERALAR